MPRNYPKPIRALSVEEINKFWSKVQRSNVDECWPWTAGLSSDGYGRLWIDRRPLKSHRVAKFLTTGTSPPDCVLHKCDNPPCCNPDHLFDGTPQDNVADMVAKGRTASGDRNGMRTHPESRRRSDDHCARGAGNGNSKLTEDSVRDIRDRSAKGQTRDAIAAMFGITKQSVWNVIRGRTWKHVK